MVLEEKIAIIKGFPLFQSLTNEEVTFIAEHARELTFPPHTIIVNQDNAGEGVYATYQGLLRTFMLSQDGRVIPIKISKAPYINGIVDVIDNERASVVATIQETHALFIPKTYFMKTVSKNIHLALALLQVLAKKLRETNVQTEYYFSSSLPDRTLHILTELAPFFRDNTITMSHEEIADIVGATRVRVTEVLNELSKQNIVSLAQRKIHVL